MPVPKSPLPPIPSHLLDALDRLYPERCPTVTDTEREIWMYAGKRELIRSLKAQKQQQENAGITA